MDRLNKWLTFTSNIAVLVGIIFLAVEMGQNTSATQAQTRNAMTENTLNWQLAISTNPEAATAYFNGIRQETTNFSASSMEGFMFRLMVEANFRLWENEWYQYQKGLFEDSEFDARKRTWAARISGLQGSYKQYWEGVENLYADDFTAEIDSIISELELSN